MTANQGPGVPAELRERLARRAFRRWVGPSRSFDAADPSVRAAFYREADEILAEIAASGHVIVARDRIERIERVAINGRAYCRGLGQYGDLVAAVNTVQPGDLDPVEPGAGR